MFFLSVGFDLFRQILEILQIVFLFHLLIVPSNYVLFFLLPVELLTFKFSYFFDLLAFVLEPLCSLFVDRHDVVHGVFAFGLCMIIDSKWPAWFEKWRISFWMEVIRNGFSIKCKTNNVLNVLLPSFMVSFSSLRSVKHFKEWSATIIIECITCAHSIVESLWFSTFIFNSLWCKNFISITSDGGLCLKSWLTVFILTSRFSSKLSSTEVLRSATQSLWQIWFRNYWCTTRSLTQCIFVCLNNLIKLISIVFNTRWFLRKECFL